MLEEAPLTVVSEELTIVKVVEFAALVTPYHPRNVVSVVPAMNTSPHVGVQLTSTGCEEDVVQVMVVPDLLHDERLTVTGPSVA